jgi:hypothetical protein
MFKAPGRNRTRCVVTELGRFAGLAKFGWTEIVSRAVPTHMRAHHDILVYPGGHRECTQHVHIRDIANVGSRGWVRLALKNGYDVRVAYAFGERMVALNIPGAERLRA